MTGTAAGHVVTKASAGTVAETVDRLTARWTTAARLAGIEALVDAVVAG